MPTFQLDDKEIEYQPGETILRAALRAGFEIPHYCFHPGLDITAQCRMCLVEIVDMGNGRGMPRPQASCSTPAAEGMKVSASSEMATNGQNVVNEFLLVNHPLDCPICDQAGECELQNIAHQYGTGHSEMEYEKRVYGLREVGSFIVLERNRCIQCSRCERFSRDIVGSHDFGAFLRGHETTFDTFEDTQISHKFQGNLADLCPVGAILNRDWRFKKRAWKFKKVPTVCSGCSTGCNVTLEHHENRVFRIKPRENMAVNRWWMCDEGRLHYKALNAVSTRLAEPLARVKGDLQPTTWEAVEQALATRLGEIGAEGDAVVGLTDTEATNEELHMLTTVLREGFGAAAPLFPLVQGKQQESPGREVQDAFIFTLLTTDKSPNTAGAQRAGASGDSDGSKAKAALGKAKVAIVLGNPWAGDSAADKAVREAASNADLVVHIASQRSPWCDVADVILPATTYAEKHGSWINKAGRLQRIQPALRPPEEARDPIAALDGLLGALGKGLGLANGKDALAAVAGQDGPLKEKSWDAIGPLGIDLEGSAA